MAHANTDSKSHGVEDGVEPITTQILRSRIGEFVDRASLGECFIVSRYDSDRAALIGIREFEAFREFQRSRLLKSSKPKTRG